MTPHDTTSLAAEPPLTARRRLYHGLRKPANWTQLVQFGLVGLSGSVINFGVYYLLLRVAGIHYVLASIGAFCVAVGNNFTWNRIWTFAHRRDATHAAFQAARFLTVAVSVYLPTLALLAFFVEVAGLGKTIAQVCAVGLMTPVSFLLNKYWSFR